jgi:predicted nucleotidyltransferase
LLPKGNICNKKGTEEEMVINKVMDEVFSTWSNVAVFRVLNKYVIGISGREVARHVGISPKNCLITLSALENLGLVNRVRGGREHHFTINREHFLVKEGIIPLLDIEKKFEEAIFKEIKQKLKNKCRSVYLFGSVARKQEEVDSDLDLCVIYDNRNQLSRIEETVADLQKILRKRYSVNASPYYISVTNFADRANKNKPPVNEVIKEGIHIWGNTIKEMLDGKRI